MDKQELKKLVEVVADPELLRDILHQLGEDQLEDVLNEYEDKDSNGARNKDKKGGQYISESGSMVFASQKNDSQEEEDSGEYESEEYYDES